MQTLTQASTIPAPPIEPIPIMSVLYELGRLGSNASLLEAMPSRDGLGWLLEHRCLTRGALNDRGMELVRELSRCLESL